MPEPIGSLIALEEHPVCEQCGTMMRKLDPQPLRPAIYFKCPGCDWIVGWVNHFPETLHLDGCSLAGDHEGACDV